MAETPQPSQDDALIAQAEISRLRGEKQAYIDSITPPFSDDERDILDSYDFKILEAMARHVSLRRQTDNPSANQDDK